MNTRGAIGCVIVLVAGCNKPPSSPSGAETLNGSERFGWDQPAADAGELSTFRYALYVDETRTEALDVTCAGAPTNGRFACTAQLPSIPDGTHTLQVASFVIEAGSTRESARSDVVRVIKR